MNEKRKYSIIIHKNVRLSLWWRLKKCLTIKERWAVIIIIFNILICEKQIKPFSFIWAPSVLSSEQYANSPAYCHFQIKPDTMWLLLSHGRTSFLTLLLSQTLAEPVGFQMCNVRGISMMGVNLLAQSKWSKLALCWVWYWMLTKAFQREYLTWSPDLYNGSYKLYGSMVKVIFTTLSVANKFVF